MIAINNGYALGKASACGSGGSVSSVVYKPAGSISFSSLPELSNSVLGNVYNITNSFTTTADFLEGAGKTYPAGTNVVCVDAGSSNYKWDVLSGLVDLTSYIQNTATGTDSLTVVGEATSQNYSINIGKGSTASGGASVALGNDSYCRGGSSVSIGYGATTTSGLDYQVAIGRSASTNAQYATAIGRGASVSSTGNSAIQLGSGTNGTANSLSVGFANAGTNYILLDGTTGKIPANRIAIDGTSIIVNNGVLSANITSTILVEDYTE